VRLRVDAPEVLAEVPLAMTETADELTFDRYGAYIAVSGSDSTAVHVWTETGAWVGTATDPAGIADLIAAYEKATRKP
jgi:hypothetical protein